MATKSIDDFKKEIYDKVMEYDEGCHDGKIRFLHELGIETPTKDVKLTFTMDATFIDDSGVDWITERLTENLQYAFEDETNGYPEDIQVTIEDGSGSSGSSASNRMRGFLGKTPRGDAVHIMRDDGYSYCGVVMHTDANLSSGDQLCNNCSYIAQGYPTGRPKIPTTDAYYNINFPIRPRFPS